MTSQSQATLQLLYRERNRFASIGTGSYPVKTIGIISSQPLARVFLKFSRAERIDDSVNFLIEAIRDKCLISPCLLGQSRLSYYYATYFKAGTDMYGADAAPMQLNLPGDLAADAETLLGPNAQLDAQTRNKLGDLFIECIYEICHMLDRDHKPKRFYESKMFREYQDRSSQGRSMSSPRKFIPSPRKIIRWGRGR